MTQYFHVLGAFVAMSIACFSLPARAASRPNVLFVVSDDLNSWLSCYGDRHINTPNLDRLAARGVRFDRAYCQYPVCNPSRASFLSGQYPLTTKVISNNTPPRTVMGNVSFLPEWFRKHGYFTARTGKIPHSKYADSVTWDFEEGTGGSPDEAVKIALESGPKEAAGDPKMRPVTWRKVKDERDTQDGQAARTAVKLIEQKRDKPFFIGLGFHKPHSPLVAPAQHFAKYPPSNAVLEDERIGTAPKIAYGDMASAFSTKIKQEATAAYRACVSFMDAQMGLVLDALDRQKLWDNTIVVFFSDHGYHVGGRGLWGKNTLFETVARVPLMIAVPGLKPGVSPRTVELVDLFPTLVELARLPKPKGLEGKSLVPLLRDPIRRWDKPAFTVVARKEGGGVAVRTERYRYAEWGKARSAELYDLEEDPGELVNLAGDPAFAKTAAELSRLIRKKWSAKAMETLARESF